MTVAALMGRRGLVTAREHTRIRDRFSQYGIETFRGTASFVDPHTLRVSVPDGTSQEIRADVVLARHRHPPLPPAPHPHRPQPGLRLRLDPDARPGARARWRCWAAAWPARSTPRSSPRWACTSPSSTRATGSCPSSTPSSRTSWSGSGPSSGVEIMHNDPGHQGGAGRPRRAASPSPTARGWWPRRCWSPPGASATSSRSTWPTPASRPTSAGYLEVNAALPDLGAAHLRGRRRGGLPRPRLHLDGAGARGHDLRLRGHRLPHPALRRRAAGRHLHHPRGLLGGRDRGVAPGEGHPLRGRQGQLRRERPRQPDRRGGRLREAAGLAEGPQDPGRPLHRPARLRARPPRRGGDGAGRDLPLLHRGGLQLPDAGRDLQGTPPTTPARSWARSPTARFRRSSRAALPQPRPGLRQRLVDLLERAAGLAAARPARSARRPARGPARPAPARSPRGRRAAGPRRRSARPARR